MESKTRPSKHCHELNHHGILHLHVSEFSLLNPATILAQMLAVLQFETGTSTTNISKAKDSKFVVPESSFNAGGLFHRLLFIFE